MKKIIINADDFGYSVNKNEAVKYGVQNGIITSASIITNMEGFEQAVNEVLPEIPFLDLGFHFNIMEGKSLTNPSLITDRYGYFNRSFPEIMLEAGGKKFQRQIEAEFRAQIERILQYKHISHVDSHIHTHAIPAVFDIVSALTIEYKIPFIRTQKEIPYKIPYKAVSVNFCINSVKNILLNTFTFINKLSLENLNTNDYFIGILYTGNMNKETILEGLKKIKNDNSVTEIIFHPSIEMDNSYLNISGKREFELLLDNDLKQELENSEYILTSFRACSHYQGSKYK